MCALWFFTLLPSDNICVSLWRLLCRKVTIPTCPPRGTLCQLQTEGMNLNALEPVMPDLSHPELHFHGGTEDSNHRNLNWALCSNLESYWCTLVTQQI